MHGGEPRGERLHEARRGSSRGWTGGRSAGKGGHGGAACDEVKRPE